MITVRGKTTIGPDIVTTGLVIYLDAANPKSYPGSGTILYDLSGNAYNGSLNGSTISSGFANFNGSSQYISCGNFGSFFNQGSLSFWINASVMASYNNPFTTTYLGVNVGIRFEENSSGNFVVVLGNDAGTYAGYTYITSGMAINTWYHICLTWNVSTNSVIGYLNSNQTFNTSNTYWATTMPSVTLGNGFSNVRYWNGKIGPFLMYNRILSSTENTQIYTSQKSRFGL